MNPSCLDVTDSGTDYPKHKPELKSNWSQTDPLSVLTLLDKTDLHNMKVNNNFNVENGSMAHLAGSQIKELPL